MTDRPSPATHRDESAFFLEHFTPWTGRARQRRSRGSVSEPRSERQAITDTLSDADLSRYARTLEQLNPGWVVIWATWRRKFCAFACWISAACVIVEASDPEDLSNQMRQVEMGVR